MWLRIVSIVLCLQATLVYGRNDDGCNERISRWERPSDGGDEEDADDQNGEGWNVEEMGRSGRLSRHDRELERNSIEADDFARSRGRRR